MNDRPTAIPVIKNALGSAWDELAPVIRRHYDIHPGSDERVLMTGTMTRVDHSLIAKLFLLPGRIFGALIPYRGTDIPATVENRTRADDPRGMSWHRRFEFPGHPGTVFRSYMVHAGGDEIIEYRMFSVDQLRLSLPKLITQEGPIPMKAIANRYLLTALTLAVISGTGQAVPTEDTPAAPATPASGPDVWIQPAAVDALGAMSRYLRTLPRYTINADISKDKVIEGDGKLQFDHQLEARFAKDQGLSITISAPERQLEYIYNYKQFTLYTPGKHVYATVDAPPTIPALMASLDEKYDLSLPLSDIFYWGTDMAPTDDIEAAFYVGPGRVRGQDCKHYAYRQADIDWQLCITEGDQPLPLKLVITTTDIAIQPQYVATLKWDLSPNMDPGSFNFTAPADVLPIQFEPATDVAATQP